MNKDDPDYVPSIFSYHKKNHNQSQKLDKFWRIEYSRRHHKSTGKTRKDEHENIGKNADITFEVENIEPTENEKGSITLEIKSFWSLFLSVYFF